MTWFIFGAVIMMGDVDACAGNCRSQDNLMQTTHLGCREEPEYIGFNDKIWQAKKLSSNHPGSASYQPLKSCSCVVFGQIAYGRVGISRMRAERYRVRIFPRPRYCLWCSWLWYHDFVILLTALILSRLSFPALGLHVPSLIYIYLLEILWILAFSFTTITTNSHFGQFALLTFQVNNCPLEHHSIISTLRLPFHWIKMPCLPFTSTPSSPSNTPKSHPSIMLHAPPGNIYVAKKPLSILILK